MNTGIPDAWDLGWKLAAVLSGWGGPQLLAAYEIERRPVCSRGAEQSLRNFHSLVHPEPQPLIEQSGAEADQVRSMVGKRLEEENERSWNQSGTHLGYLYLPSPLVIDDGSPVPEDDTFGYQPTSRPGARAPHVWLERGLSILDHFGPGFTLLDFGGANADPLIAAAASAGVPLKVVAVASRMAAELYERNLVLVRPDGHVAWRGDHVGREDAHLVLKTVSGYGPPIAARRQWPGSNGDLGASPPSAGGPAHAGALVGNGGGGETSA